MIAPDLARLCERYGVAVRYRDFWHREREPSEKTLHAVLSAMGVDPAASRNGP